jgi:hypothetical protein
VKPVLQALILAEKIYTDVSGKKIIAGTFNGVFLKRIADLVQERELPTGEKRRCVPGGMHGGSPSAYISVTDVLDGTELTLQFVNLTTNTVLIETKVVIQCEDRLRPVEIVARLPPLPISQAGTYALEVVCEGEILGSHRVIAEEMPAPEE